MSEEKAEPKVEFDEIITKIRDVQNAVELEENLSDVKPGQGNCRTRRKLKRAIEQVVSSEDIQKSMNAKVRRRVTRVLGFLAPQTGSVEGETTDAKQSSSLQTTESLQDENETSKKKQIKIPYVVFFGQLSYDTTVEDIQVFLQTNDIPPANHIRLLTNPQTGVSKGMAFVEFDSADAMYQCIALHKSLLNGRLINIERSCGGKEKEKRKQKLTEIRKEQNQRNQVLVQRLLEDFHRRNVISHPTSIGDHFKRKLYNCHAEIVKEVSNYYLAYTTLLL
jgi:RNA recognition motif-containing protein